MFILKPNLRKTGTGLQGKVPGTCIKQPQEIFHYKSVSLQTRIISKLKLNQLKDTLLQRRTAFLVGNTVEAIGDKNDAKI